MQEEQAQAPEQEQEHEQEEDYILPHIDQFVKKMPDADIEANVEDVKQKEGSKSKRVSFELEAVSEDQEAVREEDWRLRRERLWQARNSRRKAAR